MSLSGHRKPQVYLDSDCHLGNTALTQALDAKQRAIQNLRVTLQNPDSVSREVLLVAILFFINFELIDVGTRDWRPHLEGAGKLMALLSQVGSARTTPVSYNVLFDIVISDCFM